MPPGLDEHRNRCQIAFWCHHVAVVTRSLAEHRKSISHHAPLWLPGFTQSYCLFWSFSFIWCGKAEGQLRNGLDYISIRYLNIAVSWLLSHALSNIYRRSLSFRWLQGKQRSVMLWLHESELSRLFGHAMSYCCHSLSFATGASMLWLQKNITKVWCFDSKNIKRVSTTAIPCLTVIVVPNCLPADGLIDTEAWCLYWQHEHQKCRNRPVS